MAWNPSALKPTHGLLLAMLVVFIVFLARWGSPPEGHTGMRQLDTAGLVEMRGEIPSLATSRPHFDQPESEHLDYRLKNSTAGGTGLTAIFSTESKNPQWNSPQGEQPRESLLWRPKLSNATKVIILRLQKTGSRTLNDTIVQQLAKKGFPFLNVSPFDEQPGQRRDTIESHDGKWVFSGHMMYIDFQWPEPPIYVSIVRDPLARITSNYYYALYGDHEVTKRMKGYVRTTREEMANETGNHTIPTLSECVLRDIPFCKDYIRLFATLFYFCGEDPRCSKPNNWTYDRAVRHIDESLAVGLLEEFEDYLRVLERLVPSLFQGILQSYVQPRSSAAERTSTSKTRFKEPLSPAAESKLRRTLEMEYRIFNYAKDRFHRIKKKLGIS